MQECHFLGNTVDHLTTVVPACHTASGRLAIAIASCVPKIFVCRKEVGALTHHGTTHSSRSAATAATAAAACELASEFERVLVTNIHSARPLRWRQQWLRFLLLHTHQACVGRGALFVWPHFHAWPRRLSGVAALAVQLLLNITVTMCLADIAGPPSTVGLPDPGAPAMPPPPLKRRCQQGAALTGRPRALACSFTTVQSYIGRRS